MSNLKVKEKDVFKVVKQKAIVREKARTFYKYSPQKLSLAIHSVQEEKMSVSAAASFWKIPRSTLRDKLRLGTSNLYRPGPDPVLGHEMEKTLEEWLLELVRRGAPIAVEGLAYSVQYLCNKNNMKTPFLHNYPGRKWITGFFKRHPLLSIEKSEYLSRQRALLTEEAIRKWFSDIQNVLAEENVDLSVLQDPKRIFNLDETALYTNPSGDLVIIEKRKAANHIRGNDKENATLLFCADADGSIVTKTILLPYERMPSPVREAIPRDWSLGKTSSGWMTAKAFFEYMANDFYQYLQRENINEPVVVFLDGYASHLSLPVSQFCIDHNIHLICLPPNATHFIQPLDVGFNGLFKKKWRSYTKTLRLKNVGQDMKTHQIPKHVNDMGLKDFQFDIRKAFRVCGLFPFDENNLDYSKLVIYQQRMIPDEKAIKGDEEEEQQNSFAFAVFESKIEKFVLQEFESMRELDVDDWPGDIKYSALFEMWRTWKTECEEGNTGDLHVDTMEALNPTIEYELS